MTKIIDARKLPCLQPVLLTTKALAEADTVITIVDNEAAKENVSRLGNSQGCEVTQLRKSHQRRRAELCYSFPLIFWAGVRI